MFWNPYSEDDDAGSANRSFGSRSARGAYCEKCADAYRLLDLSHGASREEVKRKKWAFAELFSADRLRSMSDQARQLAEEQHKSINAACDQILRCPDCTRLRDNLNGSESRTAPEQPQSATTAKENSKPQSSLAEQVLAILKETNNKINAIAFVREQTGWDLKEAENFVDSVAPEWRVAPKEATGATTKRDESKPQPDKFSLTEKVLVILKGTHSRINAITLVRAQTGERLKETRDFVDSIASEWRPCPKQAAGATTKREAFGETSPGKFSVRMVILVMVLVVGALAGWGLFSKYKAHMAAEQRHHLYEQQHQQEMQLLERMKEAREETCAERSAARRQNSAIGASQPVLRNSSSTHPQRKFNATKSLGEPPAVIGR